MHFNIGIKSIIILFVGLGPIFWLGPIKTEYFMIIKYSIFGLLLILMFLDQALKKEFKHNITFVTFIVLLVITSIPGLVQSNFSAVIFTYRSFILILLVSWVFYTYFKEKEHDEILEIFFKATKIIGYLSIFIVLNHFFNFVDWKHISEVTESYARLVKLADTGFSTGRTVWSHSLALYFAVAIYATFHHKKKEFLLFAVAIFITQVLSGGRGGLVISILILSTYIISKINLKWALIILTALIIAISLNQEYLKKRFRLDRLEKKDQNAFNKFTAGRLKQVYFAFDKLSEEYNFIKGNGFGEIDNKIGKETDIHVVWLKKLVEGGILYLSIFIVFVILFFIRIINLVRKDKSNILFLHIFLGGMITTLFEPNAIFGSIQSYFIWWAGLAAVESLRISYNKKIVVLE